MVLEGEEERPREGGMFSCSVNHSQPEARWDRASVFCREKAGVYCITETHHHPSRSQLQPILVSS